MKPMVKLQRGGFAEIYGREGLRYSLLKPTKEGFVGYHGSTCCKDFFTDVFWSEHMEQETLIWGFSWKPGTLDLSDHTYYMAIEFGTVALGDRKDKAVRLLNAFEQRFKIPLSKVTTDAEEKLLVFSFDRAWASRPVMISLLTLLMRLGPHYDGGMDPIVYLRKIVSNGNPYGVYDKIELGKAGVIELLEKCFTNGQPPHPQQTFEQYKKAHDCHHNGGLIAFTTGIPTG